MSLQEERKSYLDVPRLPPQNIEAEQSVLGGMLLENQLICEIRNIIAADDFYKEAHCRIFEAILTLEDAGKAVDSVTVVNELRSRGQIDLIGGASYLSSLLDAAPSTANIKDYVGIVKEKSIKRNAIQAATEIVTKAYEDKDDVTEIISLFQLGTSELMKKMAKRRSEGLELSPAKIFDYFSDYRTTPFEQLNEAIGAFFAGELIVLGGRTGMGKTALMLEFLKHTAIKENRRVIFFHAQMQPQTIYTRLLSSVSGIAYNDLRKGRVLGDQIKQVSLAQEQINDAPISWFIIKDELELNYILAQIRGLMNKEKDLGLVIIENLQQVYLEKKEKYRNDRRREADTILNSVRELGINTKVPHIISSQLTRDSEKENRRPQIGDLKETGRTGEIADKVLMPYRPNYEEKSCKLGEPEEAELIVCKGGMPVILPMKFIGNILTWREVV